MNWTEMIPAQFDTSQADRATREFIATAPATLFPDLLPDVPPKASKGSQPQPMPGEVPLFGTGEL